MDELDATLESVRQALEGARDAGSAQSEAAADFVASLAASSPPGSELLSGLASQLPAACELGFASPRALASIVSFVDALGAGAPSECHSDLLESLELCSGALGASGAGGCAPPAGHHPRLGPCPAPLAAALLRGAGALLGRLSRSRWAFCSFALPKLGRCAQLCDEAALARGDDAAVALVAGALLSCGGVVAGAAARDGVPRTSLAAALLRLLAAAALRLPRGADDPACEPLRGLLLRAGVDGWGPLTALLHAGDGTQPAAAPAAAPAGRARVSLRDGAGDGAASAGARGGGWSGDEDASSVSPSEEGEPSDEGASPPSSDAQAARLGAALLADAWGCGPGVGGQPGLAGVTVAGPFAAALVPTRADLAARLTRAAVALSHGGGAGPGAPAGGCGGGEGEEAWGGLCWSLASGLGRAPPEWRPALLDALTRALSTRDGAARGRALAGLLRGCAHPGAAAQLFGLLRAACNDARTPAPPATAARAAAAWLADCVAATVQDEGGGVLLAAAEPASAALAVLRLLLRRDAAARANLSGFGGGDGARLMRGALLTPLRHLVAVQLELQEAALHTTQRHRGRGQGGGGEGGDDAGGDGGDGGDGGGDEDEGGDARGGFEGGADVASVLALQTLLHVVELTEEASDDAADALTGGDDA